MTAKEIINILKKGEGYTSEFKESRNALPANIFETVCAFLNRFSPHPKNPAIVKFFQQMGRAEELGSGIRNIKQYLPLYSKQSKFEFIEGDTFKTIITYEEPDATMQETMQETMQVNHLILKCVGEISVNQLMKVLKLKNRDNFRKIYMKPAIENGLIEMTIPDQPKNRNQKYRLTKKGEMFRKTIGQQK
ncbi:hypothetical protein H8E88_24500 [candidate division KSB1 bacterium]|nr:hypothetical protein [candidate division KSB1 bacterium]MBL7092415.1 hypothetical protein [candidate division KSB1 bacterium]